MKRLFLPALLTVAGMFASPLRADEATAFTSATLPTSGVVISSANEPAADNVCKWTPDHTLGSRRDLGQRIVNGKTPAQVNRFILRVADIKEAVGAHAPGATFVFRIMQFESNRDTAPLSTPVAEATGQLPAVITAGEYLIIDFPGVELEPSTVYGLEIGFHEPGDGHTLNFSTTLRTAYPSGRIYFHTNEPEVEEMTYSLRSDNMLFYLGVQQ